MSLHNQRGIRETPALLKCFFCHWWCSWPPQHPLAYSKIFSGLNKSKERVARQSLQEVISSRLWGHAVLCQDSSNHREAGHASLSEQGNCKPAECQVILHLPHPRPQRVALLLLMAHFACAVKKDTENGCRQHYWSREMFEFLFFFFLTVAGVQRKWHRWSNGDMHCGLDTTKPVLFSFSMPWPSTSI